MIAVRSFFFCAICAVLCTLHSDVAFCYSVEGIDSPAPTHDESVDEDATLDSPDYVDDHVDGETHTTENDVSHSEESEIVLADQLDQQDLTVDEVVDHHDRQDIIGKRDLWPYRETLWYKEVDKDGENAHLPGVLSVEDLYKQAFYCATVNNVVGLHALIGELRTFGEKLDFVLEELRTKDGNNLLLQAVKNGSIDVVRYLLSIGAEVDVADSSGDTPIDIAVSLGDITMVNSIAEMQVKFESEDGE